MYSVGLGVTNRNMVGILFFFAFSLIILTYMRKDFNPDPRWYSTAQVNAGESLYARNCLSCHGQQGRGITNWKRRNPDGSFPPPPLNGTAHTWHHPMSVLRRTIREGGQALGGKMPAFKGVLNDEEIDSVIAYFQSQWSDRIYRTWEEGVNKGSP